MLLLVLLPLLLSFCCCMTGESFVWSSPVCGARSGSMFVCLELTLPTFWLLYTLPSVYHFHQPHWQTVYSQGRRAGAVCEAHVHLSYGGAFTSTAAAATAVHQFHTTLRVSHNTVAGNSKPLVKTFHALLGMPAWKPRLLLDSAAPPSCAATETFQTTWNAHTFQTIDNFSVSLRRSLPSLRMFQDEEEV